MEYQVITSPNAPQSVGPYSQATRAGDFIFCAGQAAFDPATGRIVDGGAGPQTAQTLRNLGAILEAAGSGLDRIVKVTIFLEDWRYFEEMNEVFAQFFPTKPPARSTIQGTRWPEDSLVAIEAVALA